MIRRRLLSDFERGVLDDARLMDERIEELETQEFVQPANLGGYTFIEEKSPTTGQSITFSSIPGIYRHLRIKWRAKSDTGNEEDTLQVQFNGDTTSQYRYTNHQVAGPTSAIHTIGHGGLVAGIQVGQITGSHASLDDEEFATGVIDIPYYTGMEAFKMLLAVSGGYVVSRAGMRHSLHDGQWEEATTASIDAILIGMIGANNFVSGTKFSLYGLA